MVPRYPTWLNDQISPMNKELRRYKFLSIQGLTTVIHEEANVPVISE